MASRPRLQGEVQRLDREDEDSRYDRNGSVSSINNVITFVLKTRVSMAVGLGMSTEEWEDLKSKVDDSFWVMRVIGVQKVLRAASRLHTQGMFVGYPSLPKDHDGVSCGAHK